MSRFPNRRAWRWPLLLLLVAGCAGGDSLDFDRAAVSGQVTYGGEPVENGRVRFLPQGETIGEITTAVVEDGKYSLSAEEGPAVGTHRVEITAYRKTGETVPVEDEPGKTEEVIEQYIPETYNLRSKKTVEIEPDENEHDFRLEIRN